MSERGMFQSDRCQWCHEYGEKAEPWTCPFCAERLRERDQQRDARIAELEAALREATEWRSMETAPRDGTHIWVAWDYQPLWTPCELYWHDEFWRESGEARYAGPDPTHWLPLLAPPKEAP